MFFNFLNSIVKYGKIQIIDFDNSEDVKIIAAFTPNLLIPLQNKTYTNQFYNSSTPRKLNSRTISQQTKK